jgi:hypothetical protein
MARKIVRSPNAELHVGSTDGKYRKARPNTTIAPGTGEDLVKANRAALHPFMNYDFINSEESNMVSPGEGSARKGATSSLPVANTENYMMGQTH